MHRNGDWRWRGNAEPRLLLGPLLRRPDDELVAVRVDREVPVDDLGHEHAAGLRLGQVLAEHGPDPGLEVLVALAGLGPVLPLVAEQRGLVDVDRDVVQRQPLHDLAADERRPEDGVVGRDLGRAGRQLDVVVRAAVRSGRAAPGRSGPGRSPGPRRRPRFICHQVVERAQALEGVAAVEEPALVHLAEVPLDVAAGQRRAAEQHGDLREAERVELLQVLPHDQRRLDQQAAHAEGVGVDLLDLRHHVGDPDLDAEVVDLVAVVGADDVDQVLADVVHVALDRGQHEPALGRRAADAAPCGARGRRPRSSSSRPTAARRAAASGRCRTARRRRASRRAGPR